MIRFWTALLAVAAFAAVVSCGGDAAPASSQGTATSAARPAATSPASGTTRPAPQAPKGNLDKSKSYIAHFRTEAGDFDVQLFDDKAPVTVENFINLARNGFYDNTTFHRVIEGFMAQGGDPTGTGGGGPGYRFNDELSPDLRHDSAGTLSMANSGPNTNGSQFFITFVATPHLDGYDANGNLKRCGQVVNGVPQSCHAVFGKVISGMDNVLKIRLRDPGTATTPGARINTIEIEER